jgi:hypothetical protein
MDERRKTMRFLTMVKSKEPGGPPPAKLMEAIGKLGEQATRSGELVMTGGLLPSAMGARIRLSDGELAVIDGPFTEAKEIVGGFAIYEVESKEKAVEASLRFMKTAPGALARLGGRDRDPSHVRSRGLSRKK